MSPKTPSNLDRAIILIESANDISQEEGADPAETATMIAVAQVRAIIAVAEELSALRDKVQDVAENLVDQENHGAGSHLHYISDWLQDIARKTGR